MNCLGDSITAAREAAEASMIDICDIELVAETPSDSPLPNEPSGTVIFDVACGYDEWKSERSLNETREEVYGIKIRLPLAVEGNVQNFAAIQIKTKAGVTLESPQNYKLYGKPKIGVTAITCHCLQDSPGTQE